jgi:hypothetical protein
MEYHLDLCAKNVIRRPLIVGKLIIVFLNEEQMETYIKLM